MTYKVNVIEDETRSKMNLFNIELIEAVDEINSNLNNGFYGISIYLDLQKAFDTINHEISLHRSRYYGIRCNPLKNPT